MLQNIRNFSKSWAAKTLMILLVVSFGIWGIGDMFRGNLMQKTVAKVGKIAITYQELEHEFQQALPEARKVFGPDLSAPKARLIGVLDRTLMLLTENASFDQEVKRVGINVSDELIRAKLAATPELKDPKTGQFNARLFHEALGKGGFTERMFFDSERRSDARHLLLSSLINEISVPKILVQSVYQAQGAKRIVEVLTLDNASLTDIPEPDETALQDFYQQNGELFTAPEFRAITIARLTTDEVTKDVTVSDDDVKQAYEKRKAEFSHPEQRDFIQVVAQDEAKAKALAEAVKSSGNLAAAAKAQGLNVVELNRADEKTILPELYTTFFAMEVNQISAAVKSGLGWHVVQLKKIYPAGTPAFDDIKAKLRDMLMVEKTADAAVRLVNQLDDALAANQPLEELADSLKLRMIKIPAINSAGKLKDGKDPVEFPNKEELLPLAFSLNTGETSQVVDDNKGSFLVVRTDDIMPAHIESFNDIKNKVQTAWIRQKQAEKGKVEAEDMAKALRDGKKATSFASRKGVEVRLSKPVSMLGEMDNDLPATAMNQILQMKKDDVVTLSAGERQYVLRLADIVPVNPDKPEASHLKVIKAIEEKLPYEIIDQYSMYLHKRFPVKIDQELFDSMKKQGS